MTDYDAIIIGAGAAGLMCGITAGKRGLKVLVLDHANKPGKKILMSGGGRCNFTNLHIAPERYLSHNPHFCKSALKQYTQWDFIELVKKHRIPYHEKALGQLFCDNSSKDILNMLLKEAELANVTIRLNTEIKTIHQVSDHVFQINDLTCSNVVVATGGLSIPTMGATPFAYKIAEQFGVKVWPTRAGLVPFTWKEQDKNKFEVLSGVSVPAKTTYLKKHFIEDMLFTHRGLSGPAILQISSYWEPNQPVSIHLLPEINWQDWLLDTKKHSPKKLLNTLLVEVLPKRLVSAFFDESILNKKIAECSNQALTAIANHLGAWQFHPNGTEGYRTAEVTLGGIDCDALSSKTMEVKSVPGLYFIGEAVDVTGWLGGYNFQWAWSSGFVTGSVITFF